MISRRSEVEVVLKKNGQLHSARAQTHRTGDLLATSPAGCSDIGAWSLCLKKQNIDIVASLKERPLISKTPNFEDPTTCIWEWPRACLCRLLASYEGFRGVRLQGSALQGSGASCALANKAMTAPRPVPLRLRRYLVQLSFTQACVFEGPQLRTYERG